MDIAPGAHVHTHNVASSRGRGDLEPSRRPSRGWPSRPTTVDRQRSPVACRQRVTAIARVPRVSPPGRPRRRTQPRAGRADGDLLVGRRRAHRGRGRADWRGAAAPGRLRAARARHARHARDARGLLRPSRTSARCSSSRSAASRWSRSTSPTRRGATASRPRSSRFRAKGGPCAPPRKGRDRAGARRRAGDRSEREWCDIVDLILSLKCGGSDYTSGLASNPDARPRHRPAASISAAPPCSARSPRSWAPSTCWRRARRAPAAATQLIQVITRVETEARALGLDIRGTQPSPGNIRGGLTTIEEKSLGATHKGGERAPLEDVVGYAAPITPQGTDGDGHAGPRRRVGHRHGRRRRAGRGVHDRARHADRQSDRAGHQDHRQRAHRAGRWPTTSTSTSAGSWTTPKRSTAAAERLFAEVLAVCVRAARRRPKRSAIASSRFIAAIPTI